VTTPKVRGATPIEFLFSNGKKKASGQRKLARIPEVIIQAGNLTVTSTS
jgi:hypothetical protein